MRILFVAPRLPMPADTGAKIRTFNLLKSVSTANDVSFLSFDFDNDGDAREDLGKLGIKTFLVKAKERMRPFSIFSDKPVVIDKYYSRGMAAAVQNIVSADRFDLAHFDHLHMGQYRRYLDGIPCVLDEHNVESVIFKRCSEIEKNPVKKALFILQTGKMADFERSLIRQFSRCLAVSENDKDALMRMSEGKAKVEVISNGVDTEYFSPRSTVHSPRSEKTVVFTGSMDWLPNIDAVSYFAKEILPLVWLKNSDVKFYIVGKNPAGEVKALAVRDKRIVVTGRVDDVRPYLFNAKVFVAPLRIGGGTRLKILEAMSMGKTVVSTTIGAEGIDCIADANILVADAPRNFADKIELVLNNEDKARDIGRDARRLVTEKYDWSAIGRRLNDVYREAVDAQYN
ncbi:MAG: glycosyltransferase [Candidatus Omnitrophota bacterium]